MARNSINEDTDSGLLTVVGIRPALAPAERLGDKLVGEGLSLACNVKVGWPDPKVNWYKDNDIVNPDRVIVDQISTRSMNKFSENITPVITGSIL